MTWQLSYWLFTGVTPWSGHPEAWYRVGPLRGTVGMLLSQKPTEGGEGLRQSEPAVTGQPRCGEGEISS